MSDRGQQPAFSIDPTKYAYVPEVVSLSGMTYRQWLAGQIMAGYGACETLRLHPKEAAAWAVRDADALIAELAKEKP